MATKKLRRSGEGGGVSMLPPAVQVRIPKIEVPAAQVSADMAPIAEAITQLGQAITSIAQMQTQILQSLTNMPTPNIEVKAPAAQVMQADRPTEFYVEFDKEDGETVGMRIMTDSPD